MAVDALTLAAIAIIALIVGVIVRICTLEGRACNAGNEYLARFRNLSADQDNKEA